MIPQQFDFTAPYEGVVPHLYLDTKGLVTCGVGFLVNSLGAVLALPWQPDKEAAAKDFLAVRRMSSGLPARAYEIVCEARLSDATMRLEFSKRLANFQQNLIDIWPEFLSYPAPVRTALLDMAWNLGSGALAHRWPSLKAAVATRDWGTCVVQCARTGVQDRRNTATANLFREAAGRPTV